MFTDASNCGWALIGTKVRMYQDDDPVEEQAHELLAYMGGIFRGGQVAWSVTEKQGYPSSKRVFNSSSFWLDPVYLSYFTITET